MQCWARNPDPYLDARDAGILPAQAASQPADDIFKQAVFLQGQRNLANGLLLASSFPLHTGGGQLGRSLL